jgi:hypothetical protein
MAVRAGAEIGRILPKQGEVEDLPSPFDARRTIATSGLRRPRRGTRWRIEPEALQVDLVDEIEPEMTPANCDSSASSCTMPPPEKKTPAALPPLLESPAVPPLAPSS